MILILVAVMGMLLYNNSKQETILKDEIEENVLAICLEEEQVNYIPSKDSGYTNIFDATSLEGNFSTYIYEYQMDSMITAKWVLNS